MQTQPSLIAVDMDGTFLTDAKTFDTERFSAILDRLDARGIRFVVSSGNTYAKLQDYMRGFETVSYTHLICTTRRISASFCSRWSAALSATAWTPNAPCVRTSVAMLRSIRMTSRAINRG